MLRSENAYGATFYDIGEHSPIAGIRAGIKAYKDAGADFVVAVGGGSPVDATKAIIYNLQQESGGAFARQIAIPTTLSAAEYTVRGRCLPYMRNSGGVHDAATDEAGVPDRSGIHE